MSATRINMVALAVLCACAGGEEPGESGGIALGSSEQPLMFYDGTCTTSERNRVQRADKIALNAAIAATQSVGFNALYVRWFGTYSSGRASDVRDVFDAVVANFDFDQGDCDAPTLCTGANPPNAWISGTGPIHLCSPVFAQPDALRIYGGIAGTLIHERVHAVSTVIDESNAACTAAPDLNCYGFRDARALAAASATEAVNNADNYELFAIEAHVARVVNPVGAILFL